MNFLVKVFGLVTVLGLVTFSGLFVSSSSLKVECNPPCGKNKVCVLKTENKTLKCSVLGNKESYCNTAKRGSAYINDAPCKEGLICRRVYYDPIFPKVCLDQLFFAHNDSNGDYSAHKLKEANKTLLHLGTPT